MPEFPIPLSPDDDQHASLDLSTPPTAGRQPYGLAALMVGLVILLILRGISLHSVQSMSPLSSFLQLNMAIVGGMFVYLAFLFTRPRLPAHTLSVVAGELGLLYSYPAYLLYVAPWQAVTHTFWLAVLLFCVGLVGIIGTIISHGLRADDDPRPAMLVNFLAFFVLTGFGNLLFS